MGQYRESKENPRWPYVAATAVAALALVTVGALLRDEPGPEPTERQGTVPTTLTTDK